MASDNEKTRELTHNERLIALGICYGLQQQGCDARKITTVCARMLARSWRAVLNLWKEAKPQHSDGTLDIDDETLSKVHKKRNNGAKKKYDKDEIHAQ